MRRRCSGILAVCICQYIFTYMMTNRTSEYLCISYWCSWVRSLLFCAKKDRLDRCIDTDVYRDGQWDRIGVVDIMRIYYYSIDTRCWIHYTKWDNIDRRKKVVILQSLYTVIQTSYVT